jgi:hypothetical protein
MKKIILSGMFFVIVSGLFALSSFTDSADFTLDTVTPTLSLQSPIGGENWYIGDTHDILWTAEDTNLAVNSVYLWYSLNSGVNYTSIAESIVHSGSYPWQMPDAQSYSARVKVQISDMFGNVKQFASPNVFAITYVPPAAPKLVDVDISNNIDAVISWSAVDTTIYGTPIIPDGYLVLYNEMPNEEEQFFYYLWDVTEGTTFTHNGVAHWRDQMFYRIVAYKDYDGRMASVLQSLRQQKERKITLAELRKNMDLAGGRK